MKPEPRGDLTNYRQSLSSSVFAVPKVTLTYTDEMSTDWTNNPVRVLDVFTQEYSDKREKWDLGFDFHEDMSLVEDAGRVGVRYDLNAEQVDGVLIAFPSSRESWVCRVWVLPYKEPDPASVTFGLAVAMTEPPVHEVILTRESWQASAAHRRVQGSEENSDGIAVVSAFYALIQEAFALVNTHAIRKVLVGFRPFDADVGERGYSLAGSGNVSQERLVSYVAGDWLGYHVSFSYGAGVAVVDVYNDVGMQPLWVGALMLFLQDRVTLKSLQHDISDVQERVANDRKALTEFGFGDLANRFVEYGPDVKLSEEELAVLFGLAVRRLTVAKYTFSFRVKKGDNGTGFGPVFGPGVPFRVDAMTVEEAKEIMRSNPRLHVYDIDSVERDVRVFPEVMPVFPVAAGE